MRNLMRRIRVRVETGAVSVEYALIAVLIALVIIGGVAFFGSRTAGLFQNACQSMPGTGTC